VRNLTKTLAVVSILAPASAYPLGIGDIKLHSTLNQTLNAEIALVLSGEKPSDIQVNLAPPDKFNEAGVPWSYFLSKIRFETVVKPNGSVIIKLTSSEALKEPFLDLLLEVSWPKGNLYREFTVLVDPPAVYRQAAVPVLTTPEESPERYQREEQYAAPQRSTSSRKAQTYIAEGKYGPTRKNDTLWKVAEQVSRDDDISVEQMMIALYQENPRAFYQENVNALLAGKTLNIPEREVILKLSRKQALAEFNRQTTAWKNRLASASAETVPAQQEGLNNQLTLDAPAESEVPEHAEIAPGNEHVAAADTGADQSAQASAGKPGASGTDAVIQSKIDALEKQLAAMQQIIALKDQQLAALQNQGQAKPAVPVQPELAAQNEQPAETAPAIQEPPVKPEAIAQEPEVKPEPVVEDQPAKPESAVQEQPVQPAPKPVEAAKPVTPAKPVVPPAVQPQPEESTSLFYPVAGGIGAAMLALLGLWWRKRKVEEETNTESMFASSSAGKTYGAGLAAASSVASNVNSSTAESSFLSEFSPTDFTSFDIDQDEIDPISEADVYLAYGRYQQAEELIRHAIKDFPDRDDCKLKLLEIFHATDNKKAFEAYASELAESGKKDNTQFWAKVSDMGKEICSGSDLFSSAAAVFDMALDTAASKVAPVSLDKSGSVHERADEQDDSEFAVAKEESFDAYFNDETESEPDFDLTSFSVKDDSDDQKNDTSIDFDLSSFADESPKRNEPDSHINLDDDRVLDFDISPKNTEAKSIKADSSIDDDFQGFDFSFEDDSNLNKKGDISLDDDFQFNFNLGLQADEPQDQENILGVSDLTDMDELETKLDLAKAYIDMGDADSAKDIVKEVLEKGTSEQQKIAQTLLVDLK